MRNISQMLVEPEDLVGLAPFRLIHVSTGQERPKSVRNVPIDAWIAHAQKSRTGLDDVGCWREAFSRLGRGPDALTVVADDGRMTEAARVWFKLQYFGLPAAVLNGGVETFATRPPQAPDFAGALDLRPGSGPVGLRSRENLKADLGRAQVFDVRSAAEYRGDDLKGNSRGGHLPGARNIAHDVRLDGTRLKPSAEIAAMLDAAVLDGFRPVVSHCNGGGHAALVAGREDVQVYYLSFAVWAAAESCPIQRA